MSPRRIAVTGVTGYVGSAVARRGLASGNELVALSRRPWREGAEWRAYDLRRKLPSNLLAGVDVVVHCAYDLTLRHRTDIRRVNVDGTARLVELAAAQDIRICLISSMSAYEGTRQIYGQAKLASERAVLAAGGEAIRLGLVYGGANAGMIGSLAEAIKLPVVPLVCAGSHQFTVHVDDMTAGILTLAETGVAVGEPVGLAHPEPVRFDHMLEVLARNADRRPVFVRIPWQPIYGAMRLVEALGVGLPLRADSLLSLARPAPQVPRVELWDELGVTIRALAIGA
jgi:nucleoside-diphosphate-sugar epimerase